MLTPRDFDVISKQASKLYSQLELEIIEEIARRIANVGYANTVVRNDVLIAQEMGMLYQDAINIVAKYNNQSYEEIQGIFETAGIKTLKFDDKIYKEAGLNPVPIKQSRSIMQLIASTTEKTNYNLNNLVMTTADSSQTEFYNAINRAYMEVSTGVKSYSTAIIDTIKEVSRQGAIVTYPSGYKTSIENATRMNVITGVNQTCGKLQELRADELGWDLMELTAHPGARPEHAEWQGKIVSRSGKNKKYLTLEDIGYGTATGFKGVNCRHDWCPYYEGLSRTYIQEMLDEYNNATVKYNGEEIPLYDATQMQRKIERQIRQDKKDIAGVQGILESSKDEKLLEEARNNLTDLQIKQKLHNSTFNEFLNQTGLQKENYRLKVGKINVTNSNNSSIIKENKITLENLPNELGINLDTYNPFDNNVQEKVAKMINVDKLPEILNDRDFEDYKGKEIIRVVHDYKSNTAESAYNNTLYGDIRYSEQITSGFGRGIYFGEKRDKDELLSLYGKGNNKTINAKISKEANILEFDDEMDYIKNVVAKLKEVPANLQKFYEKETSILFMLDNIDGIKIKSNGYSCIYNRGVLKINV